MRYLRQGYEFSLSVNPESMSNGGLVDLESRFGAAHERLYGFRLDQPVELVNLRAVGSGQVEKVQLPRFDLEGPDASAAIFEQHRVHFDGGFLNANIYDRKLLRAGHRMVGPAVVTQADSTTVIHPGHVGVMDSYLNILISPEGGQD